MIVRVCIAVTCALFVALGVLALIAGQLAVGFALLLCFGVGSLGILTMRADTRVDGAIVLADVEGERAFLFPADPRKRRLLLAASAGWAAGSAALIGPALWLAIAGLAIFVPVVVSHALYLRGRHGLALTPTGVRLYGWGDAQVDWKDIRESRVFIRGSYIQLGIVPLEPVRVRRRWQRLSAWRKEVAFPAQLLIGNPFIAVLTVKQYVEAADRRAEIGTERELIRVLADWRAA